MTPESTEVSEPLDNDSTVVTISINRKQQSIRYIPESLDVSESIANDITNSYKHIYVTYILIQLNYLKPDVAMVTTHYIDSKQYNIMYLNH